MVTGKLRSTKGFENLYIQKDLMYRQRQELVERSGKSRTSAVASDESSASAVGVSVASSSGMSRSVGRGRGRGRVSGRSQVLRHNQSKISAKVGRNIYGGTP